MVVALKKHSVTLLQASNFWAIKFMYLSSLRTFCHRVRLFSGVARRGVQVCNKPCARPMGFAGRFAAARAVQRAVFSVACAAFLFVFVASKLPLAVYHLPAARVLWRVFALQGAWNKGFL